MMLPLKQSSKNSTSYIRSHEDHYACDSRRRLFIANNMSLWHCDAREEEDIMGDKFERRFLPNSNIWRQNIVKGTRINQGYIAIDRGNVVRIKTEDSGDLKEAFLSIGGTPKSTIIPQFMSAVGLRDAAELLWLCGTRKVEKVRYQVLWDEQVYEIDEFDKNLSPLVIIKIALAIPNQPISLPDWAGEEITNRREYHGSTLAMDGLPNHFYKWNKARYALQSA